MMDVPCFLQLPAPVYHLPVSTVNYPPVFNNIVGNSELYGLDTNAMSHPRLYTGHRLIRLVIAVLTVIFCANSHAQNIFFNRVQPPPGKAFLHVTGMVQDKQGYMWLATKNGLFRYDGYQMVQYRTDPLDPTSIASSSLETIAIDSSGIIWIGTFSSGLERFDPKTGIFTHYRPNANDMFTISSDSIMVICPDREGIIWIGTGRGLDRLDPKTNTFKHYRHNPDDLSSLSSNEVRAIYEDRQGVLWVGTGSVYGLAQSDPSMGGLNRFDKKTGKFTRYKHDPNNPSSLIDNKVRAIYEDSKGNFWVGTAGDGLHSMNRETGEFTHYFYDPKQPEKLSRPPINRSEPYDHITFIREDVTGALWIGTAESGINYFDNRTQRVTHFELEKDTAGAYRDRTSWWAYISRDGVLWISSLHNSLYRVNPVQARLPFYSIPSPGVTAIFEEPNGTLWLGTRRDGLFEQHTDGGQSKYFHDPNNPRSIGTNDISSITADEEGTVWVGTFGRGLSKLNKKDKSFTHYRHDPDNEKSISNDVPLCIYNDPGKDLWIGTFRGLNRMNKKTGECQRYLFFPKDTLEYGSDLITSVLKDRNGKWWAGCWMKGGAQQFDPESGKFKTYMDGASIVTLHEDRRGKLWAATSDGLYGYDNKLDSFTRFEDPIFLTETFEVRDIIEDNLGNLWVGTTNGIMRIDMERNETTLFGKNYGIIGEELIYLAATNGPRGKLYFGYEGGYFAFLPGELRFGIKPPQLTITAFRISNQLILPDGGGPLKAPLSETIEIRLSHDQDIFSFEFVGIDYSNPAGNHHLFMLENYDDNWNLAGSERKATYFNVPPGKYVFRVKVVNSYGIWTEKSITVIISPPWWTTWWFRIAAILAIAGIFFLIIRWRIRHKFRLQIQQSEKDRQLAELRQKTGELEMQALRAQMNPHFVFNSLNAINRFILQKEKAQASEYLTKFSRLVRMILQNSQSALIPLESELDSLKLYLELEALRFENRFEYTISVESDIDVDMIKVPPLIIQPYAENAIWHGLMHKEEKGHLNIDIKQLKEQLHIKITDDGIGRKQSATMTSKSATKHKSMGLKITADRIAMLQRSANKESSVIITDLEHPDGSAAGTAVLIKIPVIYDKGDTGGR